MFKWDSVQFIHSVVSDSLQLHEPQPARPPCPSPTPRVHPNSCPLSRWCHPTISSSVIPFFFCPQSFPASGSSQMSQLQHHSSKTSVLPCSAFFIVQLSHPHQTTRKTIALTKRTFVDQVMSLFFNMLSGLVITFLPRSNHLLILWLQSPSAVILEPPKLKSATVSPSICHEVIGLGAMILVFWMLSFNEINNFKSIGILREFLFLFSFKCTYFINARISFLSFIYLFLTMLGLSFLLHGLFSSCGEWVLSSHIAWASHCSGFSCCKAWALSSWAFSSCSSQAPEHRLSSCNTWA